MHRYKQSYHIALIKSSSNDSGGSLSTGGRLQEKPIPTLTTFKGSRNESSNDKNQRPTFEIEIDEEDDRSLPKRLLQACRNEIMIYSPSTTGSNVPELFEYIFYFYLKVRITVLKEKFFISSYNTGSNNNISGSRVGLVWLCFSRVFHSILDPRIAYPGSC